MFMDDGEILREYKAAKNKNEEVRILADLNGVTARQMAEWLRDNGQPVSEKFLKKPGTTGNKIRCYIAGKITGNEIFREEFAIVEEWLDAHGFESVNPAKNEEGSYKAYIDTGLKQLMTCDAICLIDNYWESKGAALEKCYADVTGMPRVMMPPEVYREKVQEMLDKKKEEKNERPH